jgi:hypothetical protein
MRIDISTHQNQARQARAIVASVVAGALFIASALAARFEDAPAPRQHANQSVETPVISSDSYSAPDPALSRLDAVVHHG